MRVEYLIQNVYKMIDSTQKSYKHFTGLKLLCCNFGLPNLIGWFVV